jgi:hypothetical protein
VVRYTIQGNKLTQPIARTDVFASFSDIAVTGPLRVAQMLFMLARNEFADVQFNKVDMEIEAEQTVRALRVRSLKTDKEKYKPGETVKYSVVLKPYRGEEQTIEGSLQLPQKLERSSLTLLAFGGPRRSERDSQEAPEFDSLDALVAALQNIPGNNELTVEFSNLVAEAEENSEDSAEKTRQFRRLEKLGEVVVYGEKTREIKIDLDKPEEPKTEEPEPKPEPKKKPCKYLFYCP